MDMYVHIFMVFSDIAASLASLAAYLHIWLIEIDFCVENKSLLHTYRRVGHTAKSRTAQTVRGGMSKQTNWQWQQPQPLPKNRATRNKEPETGNCENWEQASGKKELGKGKREERTGNWATNGAKSPGGFSHKNQFQFSANGKYYATHSSWRLLAE